MNYQMKSHSENKMKKTIIHISTILFLILTPFTLAAQDDDLPVPDKPADWVNDYAGVFSPGEKQQLSRKLNQFQYNNSTQIFIVTIAENNGYPSSMLAPLIGEKWGVGQQEKDNGLIVLLDMKAHDVTITTGYGLEEYVTDALARRIIEKEMVPAFKQGNYYAGVDAGTDVLISLLEGKFTPDEYRKQTSSSGGSAIGGILFLIIMFSLVFRSSRRSYSSGGRRSNLPLWIALGMMSGSRGSSGSFGNFSSGSGGFGGGGGFGGFTGGGGGSFGGGGATGSW